MKTRPIKVSNLFGTTLNWAVATCEGRIVDPERIDLTVLSLFGLKDLADKLGLEYGKDVTEAELLADLQLAPNYATNWALTGPIKSERRISTSHKHDGWWTSCIYDINGNPTYRYCAETELEATLRCYVASQMGAVVEVPMEVTA